MVVVVVVSGTVVVVVSGTVVVVVSGTVVVVPVGTVVEVVEQHDLAAGLVKRNCGVRPDITGAAGDENHTLLISRVSGWRQAFRFVSVYAAFFGLTAPALATTYVFSSTL